MESSSLLERLDGALARLAGPPASPDAQDDVLRTLTEASQATGAPMALPSGASILVAVLSHSVPLAVAWWKLRGPEAWRPTAGTPFPLAAAMEALDGHGEPGVDRCDLEGFLADGFARALPLTDTDAVRRAPRPGAWPLALEEAQARVTAACLEGAPWADRAWLADQMTLHGGAWVLPHALLETAAADHPSFSPGQMVWAGKNKSALGPLIRARWHVHWENSDRPRNAAAVLPWLDLHGHDTTIVRRDLLARRVRGLAQLKGGKTEETWRHLHALLSTHPQAHLPDPDTGVLLWQRALQIQPRLLGAMLRTPPPGGLAAQSPAGDGVWDAVLAPDQTAVQTTFAGWGLVERLLKRVPLTLAPRRGALWHASPSWLGRLFDLTHKEAPEAWLGPPAAQIDGATATLVDLATLPSSSRAWTGAAMRACLFARLATNATVDAKAGALLWTIQQVTRTVPSRFPPALFQWLLDAPLSPPSLDLDWVARLEAPLAASVGTFDGPDVRQSERALQALLEAVRLDRSWPETPASEGARRPRL